MLTEWDKFRGWEILEFFLKSPSAKIHVKKLARTMNLSPMTANMYLRAYAKDDILRKEKVANADIYSLDNTHALVKSLKKTYVISLIFRHVMPKISESASSVALFGSCATGEYDEKSDIDLLVIGKKGTGEKVRQIQLPLELNVMSFTPAEWVRHRKEKTRFSENVVENHILLQGNAL